MKKNYKNLKKVEKCNIYCLTFVKSSLKFSNCFLLYKMRRAGDGCTETSVRSIIFKFTELHSIVE